MALAPLDSHLTQSAHDELQGRMQTIINQIAGRRKVHDELLRKAESEAAAIAELTRLHDEYEFIVGPRSVDESVNRAIDHSAKARAVMSDPRWTLTSTVRE